MTLLAAALLAVALLAVCAFLLRRRVLCPLSTSLGLAAGLAWALVAFIVD